MPFLSFLVWLLVIQGHPPKSFRASTISSPPPLSPYLFPIHFLSCQLTELRALVDGVKENTIEVE